MQITIIIQANITIMGFFVKDGRPAGTSRLEYATANHPF